MVLVLLRNLPGVLFAGLAAAKRLIVRSSRATKDLNPK